MSITEREVEHETEVEGPITEREYRARVLEGAALEIEVRGWLQGQLCDDGGRICMMGGIDAVLIDELGLLAVMELWSPQWPAMFGGWFKESALLPLARFNDEVAQSAAEVTFLLRWRAEEIRDGR